MDPEVIEWLAYARDDLRQARRNMRARKYPSPNGACINAQQCAEKALKGLLKAQGQPIKKVHDLLALLDDLNPALPELVLLELPLRDVYLAGGHARYPGNAMTMEDAQECYDTAKRTLRIIIDYLQLPTD